jgi:TolB-like protein
MKTKWMMITLMMLTLSIRLQAETIAVTNFSTNGLHATPEITAKLARLELVKLNKYTVIDEFDMAEVMESDASYATCYGRTCLVEIGKKLNVDYILSGNIDGLGTKIVVTVKLIDVKGNLIKMTRSMEFDNQEAELQRMIGIVLEEMHGVTPNAVTKSQLEFKNEVITSNNVGRANNNGPRVGISYVAVGELNEFFMRNEGQGGLGIQPMMTNIGYQFEAQYIGTENFSALGELIFNIGGMEQGQFIPSLSLLNGFRFGSAGWEIAFGPSFGLRKTSSGLFDEGGNYHLEADYLIDHRNNWELDPLNYDQSTGEDLLVYTRPGGFEKHLDARGNTELSANWIMAFGRTFRSGALNIPVNLYYSSNKFGGVIGASIGFNVNKRIKTINQ